ncbi:putative butyrophilin subfamily 2 member A3 [Hoplias malabaricus]|uniref:putative butyrophilin subfamily 2 member A3 n=1 Tax=Hoplias malabaricus TaxID=27720 RepID=UPI003461DF9B
MAVKIVLVLLLFSVSLGHAKKVLEMECQSVLGVIGENTTIPCSFKLPTEDNDVMIYEMIIKKKGQINSVLYINDPNNVVKGDPRIILPSRTDPSLLFTNTAVSDEGEYEYSLNTNRGEIKNRRFSLRVTGSRGNHQPIITLCSEDTEESSTKLCCSASGGYPAGTIHWFDSTGINWTERATLEITEAGDKNSQFMSSTLTLTSSDVRLKCFRCVVLDGNFSDEAKFCPQSKSTDPAPVVAGVLLPVLIILGLAIIFLYLRKTRRSFRGREAETEADVNERLTTHLKKEEKR